MQAARYGRISTRYLSDTWEMIYHPLRAVRGLHSSRTISWDLPAPITWLTLLHGSNTSQNFYHPPDRHLSSTPQATKQISHPQPSSSQKSSDPYVSILPSSIRSISSALFTACLRESPLLSQMEQIHEHVGPGHNETSPLSSTSETATSVTLLVAMNRCEQRFSQAIRLHLRGHPTRVVLTEDDLRLKLRAGEIGISESGDASADFRLRDEHHVRNATLMILNRIGRKLTV